MGRPVGDYNDGHIELACGYVRNGGRHIVLDIGCRGGNRGRIQLPAADHIGWD